MMRVRQNNPAYNTAADIVPIHLLQLANEVIEDGIWVQKEFAQDMFEGLSEEEIKVFMSVFQKVYDNAERMISNEKNS